MSFTAIFQKVQEGFIGFVEELPGTNNQGATLKEARKNLKEAIRLVLEANKKLADKEIDGKDVIREKLKYE
jgi:predicted RNase H-like HicB family nuclease